MVKFGAMKSKVRFALIGAGGYGAYHLTSLAAMEKAGVAELIAIAEPNEASREHVLQRFSGVSVYSDYRDLLSREDSIDAIVIAAPIPYHYEMALACLQRDLFVYLEKPPVPLLRQWRHLLAQDTRCRISVGFQLVDSLWARKMKQWIVEGKFGEVRQIRARACWPRPTSYYQRSRWAGKMTFRGEPVFDGPATNALSHLIHNIMFLGSDQPDAFEEPLTLQGEIYRARPMEGYDLANLRGTFASGIRFSAALNHASAEELPYLLEIRGSQGWARVSCNGSLIESSFGPVDTSETVTGIMSKSYHSFVDFVTGKRPRPLTRLEDSRAYLLATNGMLLSSGGIHTIGSEWVRTLELKPADEVYEIHQISALLEEAFQSQSLFAELDAPWAVETREIKDLSAIETDAIEPYFQIPANHESPLNVY
jgi:predicted dehydrogenase